MNKTECICSSSTSEQHQQDRLSKIFHAINVQFEKVLRQNHLRESTYQTLGIGDFILSDACTDVSISRHVNTCSNHPYISNSYQLV